MVTIKDIYIWQTTSIRFLWKTKYFDENSNWTQLFEFGSFKLLPEQIGTPLFKIMTKIKKI